MNEYYFITDALVIKAKTEKEAREKIIERLETGNYKLELDDVDYDVLPENL